MHSWKMIKISLIFIGIPTILPIIIYQLISLPKLIKNRRLSYIIDNKFYYELHTRIPNPFGKRQHAQAMITNIFENLNKVLSATLDDGVSRNAIMISSYLNPASKLPIRIDPQRVKYDKASIFESVSAHFYESLYTWVAGFQTAWRLSVLRFISKCVVFMLRVFVMILVWKLERLPLLMFRLKHVKPVYKCTINLDNLTPMEMQYLERYFQRIKSARKN